MKKSVVITSFVALITIFTQAGYTQSIWHNSYANEYQISVEWIKPNFDTNGFDDNDKITFFSSVLFISGQYSITERVTLFADLPLSHWEFKDGDGIDTQAPHTALGNIYLGGGYKFPKIHDSLFPSLEIGIRVPTMAEPDFPDKRGYISGNASSPDKREAFTDEMIPLQAFINIDYQVNQVALLRIRGGASYWIADEEAFFDNQFYLAQSIQAHFVTEQFGGYLGITGKYNVAKENALFANDDVTQVKIGLNKKINTFVGELFIRVPLENIGIAQNVFGIQLRKEL